jgi:hypothetical protein
VPSFGHLRSVRLTDVLLLAIAGTLAAGATIDAVTAQEDRVYPIGMYGDPWWWGGGLSPSPVDGHRDRVPG